MSTSAGEGTSYGGSGGGAGGKFRKRPFRRPQTTPYDRRWLSKLVDPASKLISASAHLFVSSVFRKRLPPPLQPPPPPEAKRESRDRFQEAVLDIPPGVEGLATDDSGKPTSSFDSGGLSELEQILKERTFTRSEIDCLTELLRSRTLDLPNGDEHKSTESNLPQPVSAFGRRDEFARCPMQDNRIESHSESHRFHGCISTPVVSSQILEEDVAAPAEVAKAYMGSRPLKVSPLMLGLRSQAPREDASLLNNVPFPRKSLVMSPFPQKSPVRSLVRMQSVRVGVPENGFMTFMTPRSRGRSAIYNMARTPYSRVHPTTTQKGTTSSYDGYGAPSSQFSRENYVQYGSKQLALKRRSSVLEDDIGSVGPIRRLRQKSNLSTPKNLSLPASGSPLSSRGTLVGPDAAQHPISSAQKLSSMDASKHRISKTVGENEDNSMPGTSYSPVPSKSTEMATKILQQLEKLAPKEKSSEGKVVAARDKSPSKLTLHMLRGQALRSLEDVDSSKILHNAEDCHKLKDMHSTSLCDAHDTSSQKQDKVEKGPTRFVVSRDTLAPAGISNVTASVKETVAGVKTADSVSLQCVTQPSQKKWAFQMSAHEDFLELDDEIHSNEAASTPLAEGKKKLETSVVESKAVSSEAVTVDKTSIVSEFKMPAVPVLKQSTDLGTSDGTAVAEKNVGFTFSTELASSTTFQSVVASPQSPSAFDKIVPPKEPNAPPSLFSSSSKSVDKIPPLTFSSSSSVSEPSGLKSNPPLQLNPESSSSFVNVASGATNILSKIPESGKGENMNMRKSGDTVGKSETSVSSALSTSTSTSSIFSFGASANSSSLSNGSLDSSPSIFSSPAPILASSNFTNQTFTKSFINVASSTTTTMTTNCTTTATATASNSSLTTSAAAPSFPAAPIFEFGATSVAPSNSVSTVSTTSSAETTNLKAKTDKETTFGNLTSSPFGGTSFAMASTGNGIFGFGGSASSSANSLSQGSPFRTSSGSLVSSQASPAGTGVATVTQSIPIQFGSSASSPIFGTSGITSFTSSSSLFSSSTSSSSVFGSSTTSSSLFGSTASKVLGSSTTFGLSSSASSSETNSISSSGAASSWQPAKSSIFNSTFKSVSPSTGFSFGASYASAAATNSAPMVFGSSTGSSSGSTFSFTSASATASSSQTQPVFSSVPVFTAASVNGDQMNMEDSMAEDPVQASTPTVPVFGQPPISTPSFGFMFGSTAPPAGLPFQFGGQQNQSTPQNPSSPFQTSGSLDFSAGGTFSLGSGGGDKANRKIVKVKHKTQRR